MAQQELQSSKWINLFRTLRAINSIIKWRWSCTSPMKSRIWGKCLIGGISHQYEKTCWMQREFCSLPHCSERNIYYLLCCLCGDDTTKMRCQMPWLMMIIIIIIWGKFRIAPFLVLIELLRVPWPIVNEQEQQTFCQPLFIYLYKLKCIVQTVAACNIVVNWFGNGSLLINHYQVCKHDEEQQPRHMNVCNYCR